MLSRSLFSASRGRSRSSTFLCREYHSAQQGCDISYLHSMERACEKRMCGHSSTEPAGAYFPRETKPTFSSHTSKLCKTCRVSCEDARIYIIEMRIMREKEFGVYAPGPPTRRRRPSTQRDHSRSTEQRQAGSPLTPSCRMGAGVLSSFRRWYESGSERELLEP